VRRNGAQKGKGKKMTIADEIIKTAKDILEDLSTDKIDEMEPWHWVDQRSARAELEIGPNCFEAVEILDDNGEDFTAVFSDGSRAKWSNYDRTWINVFEVTK
jgi:hypothetical protein